MKLGDTDARTPRTHITGGPCHGCPCRCSYQGCLPGMGPAPWPHVEPVPQPIPWPAPWGLPATWPWTPWFPWQGTFTGQTTESHGV